MSQVKSKNTKIEILVRSELFKMGYRYRIHVKNLAGTPDIVFVSKKVAVFIDGDFWHGNKFDEWRRKLKPYWEKKIENNIARDNRNFRKLRRAGWKVIRIWEKKAYKNMAKETARIISALN